MNLEILSLNTFIEKEDMEIPIKYFEDLDHSNERLRDKFQSSMKEVDLDHMKKMVFGERSLFNTGEVVVLYKKDCIPILLRESKNSGYVKFLHDYETPYFINWIIRYIIEEFHSENFTVKFDFLLLHYLFLREDMNLSVLLPKAIKIISGIRDTIVENYSKRYSEVENINEKMEFLKKRENKLHILWSDVDLIKQDLTF